MIDAKLFTISGCNLIISFDQNVPKINTESDNMSCVLYYVKNEISTFLSYYYRTMYIVIQKKTRRNFADFDLTKNDTYTIYN